MKKIRNLVILGTTLLTGVVTYKLIQRKRKEDIIPIENDYDEFNNYELNRENIEKDNNRNYILLKTIKKTCN